MLKPLKELFGIESAATLDVRDSTPFTPKVDPDYVFDPSLLKKLLAWLSQNAVSPNLLLVGDAGVGKTSAPSQVCARLGRDVFSISCSGKTRFDDLVGTLTINESGATSFVDGPLVQAMRAGQIFLANEITRMDAGEQMRLVDVLDENGCLFIPATGEKLIAAPGFRFCATANSGGFGDESGSYAGEKVGSLAFFDRFVKLAITGLSEEQQVQALMTTVKEIPEDICRMMVNFAGSLNKTFKLGESRVLLSMRGLKRWGKLLVQYQKFKLSDPIRESLMDAVLNGTPEDDQNGVLELLQNWVKS